MDFCHHRVNSTLSPSCSRNNSSSFPLGTLTWFSAPVPSPPKFGVVCARVGSNFLACLTSRSSGPRRKRLVRLASFVRPRSPSSGSGLSVGGCVSTPPVWQVPSQAPSGFDSPHLLNGVIACSSTSGPWFSAIIEVNSTSAPSLSRNNSNVFLLGSAAWFSALAQAGSNPSASCARAANALGSA